jgi:hypothetical protein
MSLLFFQDSRENENSQTHRSPPSSKLVRLLHVQSITQVRVGPDTSLPLDLSNSVYRIEVLNLPRGYEVVLENNYVTSQPSVQGVFIIAGTRWADIRDSVVNYRLNANKIDQLHDSHQREKLVEEAKRSSEGRLVHLAESIDFTNTNMRLRFLAPVGASMETVHEIQIVAYTYNLSDGTQFLFAPAHSFPCPPKVHNKELDELL